jgi:hypothetical protein
LLTQRYIPDLEKEQTTSKENLKNIKQWSNKEKAQIFFAD